jgi:hypothetical protein
MPPAWVFMYHCIAFFLALLLPVQPFLSFYAVLLILPGLVPEWCIAVFCPFHHMHLPLALVLLSLNITSGRFLERFYFSISPGMGVAFKSDCVPTIIRFIKILDCPLLASATVMPAVSVLPAAGITKK